VGGGFVRRKLRLRRPRHATVVAYLALFIALGGGTALAAFVVSSNSEIGPNTIYGHNAPAGANVNVNLDSVTGADVKEGTLARVPSAANGARKFDVGHARTDAGSPSYNIFSLNEMSLTGYCWIDFSGNTIFVIQVGSSVAADVNYEYDTVEVAGGFVPHHDPVAAGAGIGAGGGAVLLSLNNLSDTDWQRAEGQFVYHNAARVISGTFYAIASDQIGTCQMRGSAMQAPN
jgi:hypothetical protein